MSDYLADTDKLAKEMINSFLENDSLEKNEQISMKAKLFPIPTNENSMSDSIRSIPFNLLNEDPKITRNEWEVLVSKEAVSSLEFQNENTPLRNDDEQNDIDIESQINANWNLSRELFGEPFYESDITTHNYDIDPRFDLSDEEPQQFELSECEINSENSSTEETTQVEADNISIQKDDPENETDAEKYLKQLKFYDFESYTKKFYFSKPFSGEYKFHDELLKVLAEEKKANSEKLPLVACQPEKPIPPSTNLNVDDIPFKWVTEEVASNSNLDNNWPTLDEGKRAQQSKVKSKNNDSFNKSESVDADITDINNGNQSVFDYLRKFVNNRNTREKDPYLAAVDIAMRPIPNQPEVGSKEYNKAAESIALYGIDFEDEAPINEQPDGNAISPYVQPLYKRSEPTTDNQSTSTKNALIPLSSEHQNTGFNHRQTVSNSANFQQHLLRNIQQQAFLSAQQTPVFIPRVQGQIYQPVVPITYPFLQQSMSSGMVYTNQYVPPRYLNSTTLRESTQINTSIVQQQFNLVAAGIGPNQVLVQNQMLQQRITQYISSMTTRIDSNANNSTLPNNSNDGSSPRRRQMH